MEHIQSYNLFEGETSNPQDLKALRKVMRKASNERGIWYGMFANPSTWGVFQFPQVDEIWIERGHMSVMQTGDSTTIMKRANDLLNPLGWEMVKSGQRDVKVQKLQ